VICLSPGDPLRAFAGVEAPGFVGGFPNPDPSGFHHVFDVFAVRDDQAALRQVEAVVLPSDPQSLSQLAGSPAPKALRMTMYPSLNSYPAWLTRPLTAGMI